jgi:membrane protein YqaA with SNARE-associated domain
VASEETVVLAVARTGWRRSRAVPLAVLGAVVLFSVAVVLAPLDYKALASYGYVGVFLVTLVTTAALIAPAPYLAVIALAGAMLDPALVALTAGVAAAIGEFSGYLVGRSGRCMLPPSRLVVRLERVMRRHGALCVLLVNLVPNPVVDAMGMIAGASRMSVPVFVAATFLGKTARFLLIAYGAAWVAARVVS